MNAPRRPRTKPNFAGPTTYAWILFTIPGAPNINMYPQTALINTVFWSLVYEWKFYLLLPLLAVFAKPRVQFALLAFLALSIWCYSDTQLEWFFVAGCLAAAAVRWKPVSRLCCGPLGTAILVGCAGATLAWQPMVYSATGAALLFVPFVMIASGNSIFGFLTNPSARFLGLLSYSIYLLHNWVLFLLSRVVNHFRSVAELTQPAYWALGALVVLSTVAMAAFTYRYIELPFIQSNRTKEADGIAR
ncbi:acyltransferase [Caballeronia terrestris]|uniref:Acyltransferase n=2 Tax=Caballeronia terrestris TaxID=1226301 RepID=A0A158KTX1_9BURK|nr:acyltransferase [Caballeronia terrestris]